MLLTLILFCSTILHAGELELTLMNYNIKGLPLPWIKHGKRYKTIGNNIRQYREQYGEIDVLALQEAFHRKTIDVSNALQFQKRVLGPEAKGLRTNAGLETLTNWKVESSQQYRFTTCASWDCLSRKGVVHTRLSHPDLPVMIDLYNTHMQADPSSDPVTPQRVCETKRELQALEMMRFVQATRDPANILILLGDFNFKPNSKTYPWFSKLLELQDTFFLCAHETSCGGSSDPMGQWLGMIDHQFFRAPEHSGISLSPIYVDKLFYDPTGGKKLSDHEAVVATYLIRW